MTKLTANYLFLFTKYSYKTNFTPGAKMSGFPFSYKVQSKYLFNS